MRLHLAIILLLFFSLPLLCLETSTSPLILFTNDGTFYRLDVQTKTVNWHSTLNLKLMSFQMEDMSDLNSTYFLPTIDGHFLYIDKKRQVVVQRSQVQHLLNVCFQGLEKDNIKYFVYQKFEYFVLNIQNGNVQPLEEFIKSKKTLEQKYFASNQQPKEAILVLSQKFLKQLTKGLQVKWSSISSKVNLISIQEFFKQPTKNAEQGLHSKYTFKRQSSKDLKIITDFTNEQFQVESLSPTLAIFSYNFHKSKYISHSIELSQRPKLALQWKGSQNNKIHSNTFEKIRQLYHNNGIASEKSHQISQASQIDILNVEYLPINPQILKNHYNQDDSLLFCVNSFRTLMRLKNKHGDKSMNYEEINKMINNRDNHSKRNNQQFIEQDVIPPTIPFSYGGSNKQYERQKQQPVAIIFSVGILIIAIYILYKIGFKKIMKELSKIDEKNQSKIQQLQKRLRDTHANNISKNQSNLFEINRSVVIRKTEQYVLHPGRFLNQEANIYVASHHKQGFNLENQLEQILKISNKGICKLYYYTLQQNNETKEQQLLIICQKNNNTLSRVNIQEFMKTKKSREILKEILCSLVVLSEKINFNKFLLQAIIIQNNVFKIDIIPAILASASEPKRQNIIAKKENELDKTSIEQENLLQQNIKKQELQTKKEQDQNENENEARKNSYEQSKLKVSHKQLMSQDQANASQKQFKGSLIEVFYFIATKGQLFRESFLNEESKTQKYYQPNYIPKQDEKQYSDPQFLLKDFLNFIYDQEDTPDTQSLLRKINRHPYLWDSKQKILFFTDFSNYVQTHIDNNKLKKLQQAAKDLKIIKIPWVKQLHSSFTKDIASHRKYDYSSVRDLIRVVRNKINHFHELPKDVKIILGKTPEEFVQYFLWKFPKLLPFMYVYSIKKRWKLHAI